LKLRDARQCIYWSAVPLADKAGGGLKQAAVPGATAAQLVPLADKAGGGLKRFAVRLPGIPVVFPSPTKRGVD